jgi:electron transfer flavoprotein alpha/beta subunit
MKILVCFKVVPDLDAVIADDWNACTEGNIDLSYAKKVYSCFDEAALEMALRLGDTANEQNQDVDVTALTIGSGNIDNFLKNLYAVKVNKVIKIECDRDIRFNACGVAGIIASHVKEVGVYDAILMGRQAGVGDNGQTALLTAEMLGYPCITQVIELVTAGNYLRVTNQVDNGVRRQSVRKPVMLVVGNAVHPYLRIATLREKMAAAKSEIIYLPLDNLIITPSELENYNDKSLVRLYRENKEKRCKYIEGASAGEKAQILYDRYLKEGKEHEDCSCCLESK